MAMRNDIKTKNLIKWLWRNSKGARRQAVANTLTGFLDVACQLLWVLACKHAIDIATGVEEGSLAHCCSLRYSPGESAVGFMPLSATRCATE